MRRHLHENIAQVWQLRRILQLRALLWRQGGRRCLLPSGRHLLWHDLLPEGLLWVKLLRIGTALLHRQLGQLLLFWHQLPSPSETGRDHGYYQNQRGSYGGLEARVRAAPR